MGLEARVERWQRAGVIDSSTARRILEFESSRSRPKVLYAVGGMGASSVALGALALIASNWQGISADAKIGSMFALGALFACLLALPPRRFPSQWAREVAIVLYAGLTLGSYALVGQIYHLRGLMSETLALWWGCTALLFWQSRGAFLPYVWTTISIGILHFFFAEHSSLFERRNHLVLLLASAHVVPAFLLAWAGEAWLKQRKPSFASAFHRVGAFLLLATGTLGQIFWHSGGVADFKGALGPAFLFAIAAVTLYLFRQWMLGRFEGWEAALVLYCTLTPYLAIVAEADSAVLGALGFLGLWAIVARVAYLRKDGRLFNAATGLIGLRLLILYGQKLGGFVGTGLGLIGGGVLTLLLTWLWMKQSRKLTRGWRASKGEGR